MTTSTESRTTITSHAPTTDGDAVGRSRVSSDAVAARWPSGC